MAPGRPPTIDYLPRFLALTADEQLSALALACEPALAVWRDFAAEARPRYRDAIVYRSHPLDAKLPARALGEVQRRHACPEVAATLQAYVEPILSLQDGDWELPRGSERVEHAYYSIYLLHRLTFVPETHVTPTLVLNQAISATRRSERFDTFEERYAAWWSEWEAQVDAAGARGGVRWAPLEPPDRVIAELLPRSRSRPRTR
jgi:hypothetical protein